MVPLALACAWAMSGCANTDSNRGSCEQRLLLRAAPSQIDRPEIIGVCHDDRLKVVFSAARDGRALTLSQGDVSATIAKLVPGEPGQPSAWQSYVNRIERPVAGPWPGTQSQLQANRDTAGRLGVAGRGLYWYEFATDIRNVQTPAAIEYEPHRLHRVALQIGGAAAHPRNGNPTHDFIPAGGSTTDVYRKQIAATTTCNSCHNVMAFHGGGRNDVEYCVTCHNPGSTDAQSGESLDLAVMAHRIHSGHTLPSVANGGLEYAIWGFGSTKHDYSHAAFPQDMRNCARCHQPGAPETPDAADYLRHPTSVTCGSCHDDVRFDTDSGLADWQRPHSGGVPVTDSSCATCHTPDAIEMAHATTVASPHNPQLPEGFPILQYELVEVQGTGPGEEPEVTFRVYYNGAPLDLRNLPAGLALGPTFLIYWSSPLPGVPWPEDFNNADSGQPLGQPRSVAVASLLDRLIAEDNGAYRTPPGALGRIPDDAFHGTVAMQGRFMFQGQQVAVDSVAGSAPDQAPRRAIVAIEKCQTCHETLSLHGNNRVNHIETCVGCHNPAATDVRRRPVGATVDGLAEQSVDFRSMIHKIHMGAQLYADQYVVYGFGNVPHDFGKVHYPRPPQDCLSCHIEGTYGLPLVDGALATTKSSGASLTDLLDDLRVSPSSVACGGCHDSPRAEAHMRLARPFWSDAIFGTEADDCGICHGPGKFMDVENVHRVP